MTREEFQIVYDQGAEATFALFQDMQQASGKRRLQDNTQEPAAEKR